MKKIFLILAAVLAIAIPKATQAVDVEGMYAGGIAGLNFMQYNKNHVKKHFKAGWLAGANGGYRWCNGIRLEAETTYRYNQIKSVRAAGFEKIRVRGHVRTWSFMANGLYEIPVCWCVTPYVGAGIGYDLTKIKACLNREKNGFAWQVIAGGLYPIDDCMEMGLEYRFHHGREKSLYNHSVDLKFNLFF